MSSSTGIADRSPISARQAFQRLSYLQYPALLVAFAYAGRPLFNGMEGALEAYNSALLYAGVGVGMSSLQDPSKTQNTVSKKVWQDPRKGALMLWLISAQALLPIVLGLLGAALAPTTALSQLALGMVAFGLGMIGLLKTAIEMREHHRLDKQSPRDSAAALEADA